MQHVQKENRQKPSGFTGFVAGAEGLGLGCRLGRFAAERHWRSLTPRHAPQAGLRAHLVAKSYRTLTKKSGTAEAIPDFFGRGRRTRTLGTRFWSGCGEVQQGAGKSRCCPVPAASKKRWGAGLVLGGNYPSQNRRKRAENPRKSRKHIDLNRQRPYNKKCRGNPAGVCCRQAVSHSLLLNAERG